MIIYDSHVFSKSVLLREHPLQKLCGQLRIPPGFAAMKALQKLRAKESCQKRARKAAWELRYTKNRRWKALPVPQLVRIAHSK